MLRLLLVSIHPMTPVMTPFESQQELKRANTQYILKINLSSNKEIILCKHCKRTASNGIRCLGMCVADNDY